MFMVNVRKSLIFVLFKISGVGDYTFSLFSKGFFLLDHRTSNVSNFICLHVIF